MNTIEYRNTNRNSFQRLSATNSISYSKKATLVQRGFTIVELMIVIVVIAILAAITVIAFMGVQDRAEETQLQSDLRQAGTQLEVDRPASGGTYPDDDSDLSASDGTRFEYTTEDNNTWYCLSATSTRRDVRGFHISSDTGRVQEGTCPEHSGGGQENGQARIEIVAGSHLLGSGFAANETVELVIVNTFYNREAYRGAVTVDAQGGFSDEDTGPRVSCMSSAYRIQATGQSSGRTAQVEGTYGYPC